MEWSRDTVICLIQLFEKRPCLWDKRHKYYRDRDIKNEAFLDISERLGLPCIEVERKLNTLLTQYRREKHVQTKMESAGCIAKKPWFGYNLLKFLDKAERKVYGKWSLNKSENMVFTNHDSMHNTFFNPENINVVCQQMTEEGDMPTVNEQMPSIEQMTENITQPEKERKRKHTLDGDRKSVKKAFSLMKTAYKEMQNRDDLKIFAEGVEVRLRKLRDKKKMCILKHQIETLLFTAEMDEFNETDMARQSASDERRFSQISGTTPPDDVTL